MHGVILKTTPDDQKLRNSFLKLPLPLENYRAVLKTTLSYKILWRSILNLKLRLPLETYGAVFGVVLFALSKRRHAAIIIPKYEKLQRIMPFVNYELCRSPTPLIYASTL